MRNRLQPNTTQIPNIILDEWLPTLNGAEIAVLMVIVRQTYGWHKESDFISITRLIRKTGLSSRAISYALKQLKEKGYIQTNGSPETGKTSEYRINLTPAKSAPLQNLQTTPAKNAEVTPAKSADTKETKTKKTLTKITPFIVSPLKKSSLESLTKEDVEQIAEDYHVSAGFVRLQLEKMSNWLGASGKSYKDYKKALRNWVLRDAEKLAERTRGDPTKRSIDARNL